MVRRLIYLALIVLGCSISGSAFAKSLACNASHDAKRVALVVGNGIYAGDVEPTSAPNLLTPHTDAVTVATALCNVGFAYVDLELDRSAAELRNDLKRLSSAAGGNGKLALFYYSGHGSQIAGRDYVVPVGLDPSSDAEIQQGGIPIADALRAMGHPRADYARIVVFDACRSDDLYDGEIPTSPAVTTKDPNLNQDISITWASTSGLKASDFPNPRAGTSPYSTAFSAALRFYGNLDDVIDFHYGVDSLAFRVMAAYRSGKPVPRPETLGALDRYKWYYEPPAIAAMREGRARDYSSAILAANDAVFASLPQKDVTLQAGDATLTAAALLEKARKALARISTTAKGEPLRGPDGNTLSVPDFKEAARYWTEASQRHVISATRRLGDLYINGRGVPLNAARACSLYKTAAQAGDRYGWERLGGCYRDGYENGVKDYAHAKQAYERAIALGLNNAKSSLAYLYVKGQTGFPANPQKALALFQQAEHDGVADAPGWIGWMLWSGTGTAKNIPAATREFEKGAAQGDVSSMEYLSFMLAPKAIIQGQPSAKLYAKATISVDPWFIKEFDLNDDN